MEEDKKFEVLLGAFFTHGLGNEQYILISRTIPTGEINLYRTFESYGYEEKVYKLGVYDKILGDKGLIEKINMFGKNWGFNFEGLRKGEIPHPKGRAHFYYAINVGPTIIEYNLGDKIIMFKLKEEKDGYQLSYKFRNSTFETKNFKSEKVEVSLYGKAKGFPHKIFYERFSRIYSKENSLSSEIEKGGFEDIEIISTMEDVLNYIEKIIKKYDKDDISYGDWSKEYIDDELPF